jgi:hypothetical protein
VSFWVSVHLSLPWRSAPAACALGGRSWASLAHSSWQNARISRFPGRSMPLRTSSMRVASRACASSTSLILGRMRPTLSRMHPTEQISRNYSGSAGPTRANSRQKAPTTQILLHPTRLRRHATRIWYGRAHPTEPNSRSERHRTRN